jgi:hypothetical protein
MPALPPLQQRADEVDDLDAGAEDLGLGFLLDEGRGGAVDRVGQLRVGHRSALVHGVAGDVEDPAEDLVADRHADRGTGVGEGHAALEAVGGAHGDRAHPAVAEVLLDFEGQGGLLAVERVGDAQGVVDGRQARGGREIDVDHGADDLDDGSGIAHEGNGAG